MIDRYSGPAGSKEYRARIPEIKKKEAQGANELKSKRVNRVHNRKSYLVNRKSKTHAHQRIEIELTK